jgi:flavin reductase (DIM6/NTAB) family NADH-FMN oxidoreductase RutF
MGEDPESAIDFGQPGSSAKHLRKALARFVTGVTIVTTRTAAGTFEGLTVNSFSPVSLDPPLVLWSLRNNATSLNAFLEAEWFAVNVLGAAHHDLSQRFAVSSREKFVDFKCAFGLGGCPLIAESIARFECRLERKVPGGDHVILIGWVERATYREGEPLLFHDGAYCVPVPIEWDLSLVPESPMLSGLTIEPHQFF